jgi:hypothetical protein
MRWTQLVVLSALATAPLGAQQRPLTVTPFETEGSVGLPREDYDALSRALGAVLAFELDARRDAAVTPLNLPAASRAGRVDLAAARSGTTAAKAALIVVGTLLDQYGDIHLEARVLDGATGNSLAVVQGDPALATREKLSEAVADLAGRVVKDSLVGGVPEARWRRNLSIVALVQFGRGLRAESAGDRNAAATAYRAALSAAPTLDEAKAALTRVGG